MVRRKTITILLLSAVVFAAMCTLLLPFYLSTSEDSEGVSSHLLFLHDLLFRYIKLNGHAPRTFEDLMPSISELRYGSECNIVRSGDNEYVLTITSPTATVVIQIRYVVNQEGHVEEFNAFLVNSD